MEEKKQTVTPLLKLLAEGSTDKCRELLKKYGQADARNCTELESKLAKLYAQYPDKFEIEQDFASIHPHADFILKYNNREDSLEETPSPSPLLVKEEVKVEQKSNCAGCGGTCSHADGNEDIKGASPVFISNVHLVVGCVAVVAVTALFLHYHKK